MLLQKLKKHAKDPELQSKWAAVKRANKERLSLYVESALGVKLNPDHLFDVHVGVLFLDSERSRC